MRWLTPSESRPAFFGILAQFNSAVYLAGGQASNPSVPYFGKGHDHWLDGTKAGLLPAERRYELHLIPDGTHHQFPDRSWAG